MNEKSAMSRRKVMSRLGAGLVAPAASRSFAAEGASHMEFAGEKLQDPTTKYPKPPLKSQSQAWPGLASKMVPRPDHGEDSYRVVCRVERR
jgi:hypothetical protein